MDLLIRNCTVIDGSGAPAYPGSVGLHRGKLALFPGSAAPAAKEVVDGTGLTAVPGFIDAHSHGDLLLQSPYATLSKASQGFTTEIAGQCGVSMFPARPREAEDFSRFLSGIAPSPDLPADLGACESAGTFFAWLQERRHPLTTRSFVGHGALRLWAMGYADRRPEETELSRMKAMLRRCIREGALGLSTGLVYAPSCYGDNEEILSLLRVVHEEGGVYACHPRNEADRCVEARAEQMELARQADVPLCVSHLKAAGRDNWGKPERMLRDIQQAAERGQRILIDDYPYTAGCTSLNVSIPPKYFTEGLPGLVTALRSRSERAAIRAALCRKTEYENYIYNCGGFDHVFIGSCPVTREAEGLFVSEYAQRQGKDPFDAYFDLLADNGGLGLGVYFHMDEADVVAILSHPLCALGTDGLLGPAGENPHPRAFGSTGRFYNLLVREKKLLSPEQAVRKMTGLPTDFLHLADKGYLRDGYDGDLVLLDLPRFSDAASYKNGAKLTAGVERVYAGGTCIYRQGELL